MAKFPKMIIAVSAAISITAGLYVATARADTYPSKPIRVVVPYAAGGATDILARTIAEKLRQQLGQPLVIENKPGANTNIGAVSVARADPDGYTLLFANDATFTANPALNPSVPYDMLRDFAPVAPVAYLNLALVVSNNVPVKDMAEFSRWAKNNSGKIAYGSYGMGSQAHIMGEMFNKLEKVEVTHVPYKGSAPATTAVASGEVAFSFPSLISAKGFIQGGRVRVLAISGDQRSPLLPNVPTFAEAGFKDIDIGAWYAFFAPKGTPDAVVSKFNQAMHSVLSDKQFVEQQLTQQGMRPIDGTPKDLGAMLQRESVKMKRIVQISGAKLE